jgi:DHA1 family tetracycline resistance protein-like MFS transporter
MTAPTAPVASRSPLLFIFLTVFIDLLGFGIVIPLLPIYSKAYQATNTELGLLFACFSGMQFLFAPMWGRLSDRIGRRPVLIGGLVGTALAYTLFAYIDVVGAWAAPHLPGEGWTVERTTLMTLFASRLLAGFFGANVSTAFAFIADVTTPENRAKGMGLVGAAFGLGFTIGPAVGGELSQVSLHAPGIAAAALSISAALFGYLKLPVLPRTSRTSSRVFSLEQLRGAAADPRIGLALTLSFLVIVAFSAFESMFIPLGLASFPEYFGQSEAIAEPTREQVLAAGRYAGRYLFVVGLISAVIQGGFIRRLVPRFGETKLAIAGQLILGLGLFIVGAASSFWVVVLGCVVMPFGLGINNPSVNSMISRSSPQDQQGAYLGLQQSLSSLARMAGPLTAGALFDLYGARAPFFVAAAVLVVAAALAWRYHARFGASFAKGPALEPRT